MELNSSLEEIEKKFANILNVSYTQTESPTPTFQEISGYPNYENVLSNIYKFFLEFEHHGLDDLFIQGLDDCIENDVVLMEDIFVFREFITKKGGRIDLVLSDSSEIENATQIVIIENKIYHHLDNDLEDYWDTFSHVTNKSGILLSLNHIETPEPFTNITHKEWMINVKKRLGNYIQNANSKYLVFVQDFFKYIDGFYKSNFDMDSLKFLFDNGNKIDQLITLRKNGFNFLRNKLISNIDESNYWHFNSKTQPGISVGNESGNFLLYIQISSIFSTQIYRIECWLYKKETISKWNSTGYTDAIKQLAIDKEIVFEEKSATKEWVRIAIKEYGLESNQELINLDTIILSKIENDWTEFKEAIEQRIG